MNAPRVCPPFPVTYWGFGYTMCIFGKRPFLSVFDLLTVAALLPGDGHIRIVELNVDELHSDNRRWAETVLTAGLLIQARSMQEVVACAVVFKLPVAVVGRPACTACPHLHRDADEVLLVGAEGRIAELLDAPVRRCGRHVILEAPASFPDIGGVPVQQFDLLDLSTYASVSVQFSLSGGADR